MNGYLKIKTKLDNSGIDKDIVELEDKIKKAQTDNLNLDNEASSLQEEINQYENLCAEADKYKEKIKQLNAEKSSITAGGLKGSDVPQYNSLITQIEQMKQKYAQATAEIDKQSPKIEKVTAKLAKIKGKQAENNTKMQEFKDKIEAIKIGKVKNQVNNIGRALQNQIGKIAKMATAVIGVRTAYNAVRSAISMVSQYNSQVSTDLEYMRYCIANALAPAVQKLVQLLYTALSYINAITTAWFGINLFSKSSAKNFSKMQSSASSTAKSAKEIQKSLQGFDEMNVLSDSSSTGTDAGGAGVDTPSMDLSNIQGEVPKWLQWIIDNKALILGTLGAIAGIIGAIKIAKFIQGFSDAIGIFGKFSAGIALIVAGLALLSGSLINMILNWDEMTTKEKIISVTLAAIGAAFIALGYAIATGISAATLGIGAIIAAVVALVTAVGTLIFKWASEEEAIMSVADAEKKLEEATKNLEEANNSYIDSVDKAEDANQRLAEAEEKCGISGEELYKKVQEGTLDYKDMTAEQKEVYKAYLNNETAQKELEEATKKLTEAKKQEKIASWENKLATMAEAGQYDKYKKAVVDAFNKGELSAEEARDLIGKSMSGMSRDSQKTFMEDLPGDIKNGLDPKNYETTGQKIGKWFNGLWNDIVKGAKQFAKDMANGVISKIESMVNKVVDGINFLIKGLNKISFKVPDWLGGGTIGVNIGLVPKVSLPRLAKGGVISTPTQAIIGEAGREAVVPLENNLEWLDILADKLASKIGTSGGSYIIQMDSRTIQRGLAKRKQELAFATNGRS